MSPAHFKPGLHHFAVLTAVATFALLGVGGLVTSHGVGMAVPDWPNTYGYNMFFFPVSRWVGGIFYEHTHRLLASAVGFMTTVLALWLYGQAARPLLRWGGVLLLLAGAGTALGLAAHRADSAVSVAAGLVAFGASFIWPRSEPSPRWLRRMGLAAWLAVVLQGVLGGLRVVLFKDQLGIFHATLGQLFFVLACALALFTSRWWAEGGTHRKAQARRPKLETQIALGSQVSGFGLNSACGFRPSDLAGWLFPLATCLILCQLVLGATMRHQHAGLAIPDFPLAYGKVWPAMDAASVSHYNQQRLETTALNPITGVQIFLQMAHRLLAVVILALVGGCAWLARGEQVARLAWGWFGFILLQALLGAATIWSGKAADIATAHVLVGALSLAAGTLLSIVRLRERGAFSREQALKIQPQPAPAGLFNGCPSAAAGFE